MITCLPMERKGGKGGRGREREAWKCEGGGWRGEVAPAPRVKGELRLEGVAVGGRLKERWGGWEPHAIFSILS